MEDPNFNLNNKEVNLREMEENNRAISPEIGDGGGVSEEYAGVDSRKFDQTKVESPEKIATEKKEVAQIKSLKDKLLGIFGQAPQQLQEKYTKLGQERLEKNSALRAKYEKFRTTEGEGVAEAYKEAIGKWTYVARNENGEFIDTTRYTAATGEESALKK